MRQTCVLRGMASTFGGMRRILKKQPSHLQYIRWSVETGIHKDLHQRQPRQPRGVRRPQAPKYPVEYEILSLNPPIPDAPRLSKKEMRKQRAALPTDKFVKSYMRRYDARMKTSSALSDAEKEDYYYRKTLGVAQPGAGPVGPMDMSTAMGRKSAVLSHAYDFALKQYEVLQTNDSMTEEESIAVVEEMLKNEEKAERFISRDRARSLVKEKEATKEEAMGATSATASPQADEKAIVASTSSPPPSYTIPSILHSKPRTIQALNIWGKRLNAVPYNQWTLGASTALDHWIAVDVLGMSEESWNRLLDGELEIDAEKSRGTELNIGDMARNRDIITVRSTLFPETVLYGGLDESDELLEGEDEKDAAERSIDELLASLGGFEDSTGLDDVVSDDDLDSRVDRMMDSLQDWRAKNEEIPFKDWDEDAKEEFNKWFKEYINIVSSETDGKIDLDATRDALLSEPPQCRDESNAFWSQVSDETDAEIFLHHLAKEGVPSVTEDESPGQKKAREALETFLGMPYSKQLSQIISLGALRPMIDEYSREEDRVSFMERYGETLLEGMEIEHLVSDPTGSIAAEDIKDQSLLKGLDVGSENRFSIKMVPYGTDEFGQSRSEKARALYRAWNMHKAGQARYAEVMYKKGQMPLKEGDKIE